MHQQYDELVTLKRLRMRLFRICEALLRITSLFTRANTKDKALKKMKVAAVYNDLLDIYGELKGE